MQTFEDPAYPEVARDEIFERDDTHELAVMADRETSDAELAHPTRRGVDVVGRVDRLEVLGRDVADSMSRRILALCDDGDNVALADRSNRMSFIGNDDEQTEVLLKNLPRGLWKHFVSGN